MEGKIRELRREVRALKDRMGSRSASLEPERLARGVESLRGPNGAE